MIKGDAGDEAVERLLRDTEQEVVKIYSEASKSAQKKFQTYLRAFQRKDAEKQTLVASGELSVTDYNAWKQQQIMVGQRWQDMVAVLTEDMVNADKIALSIINGHMPEAYAVNVNYGAYQIEHGLGINTSFTLYDRHTVERLIRDNPDLYPAPRVDIPKDRRWNKRQINSQVTQAILQGEPVKTLAKRIFPEISGQAGEGSTPHKNAVAAMRTARTAMTGAQNAGRIAAYSRAEDMGIQMLQEWVASHDGHTRESHLDVDGEQVPVGSAFSNDCKFPGDPGGPPEEVYNCRCSLVPALKSLGQIKDKDYKPSQREIDIAAYEEDKDAHKMSFDEWQKNRGQTNQASSAVNLAQRSNVYEERKRDALRFENREDADAYLRPKLDENWDNLKDVEKYGVWRYTENSNPMNKPLSGYESKWDRDHFKGLDKARWSVEDRWREQTAGFERFGHRDGSSNFALAISALTKGINKYSMNDDMWVARGSDNYGLAGLFESNILSYQNAIDIINTGDQSLMQMAFVGQTFTNHAFTSTGIASDAGFGGNVSYEIFLPKGTHAIYAEPQSAWGATVGDPKDPHHFPAKLYEVGQKPNFNEVGFEAEIILQRGTQFKVSDIYVEGGGEIHIKMEVVSQPDYFKNGYERTGGMAA